jgi:hypothetical protein
VRILVSANSAAAAWDLRCEIRENLIDFLQHEHPNALPRRRQEVMRVDGQNAPTGHSRRTSDRNRGTLIGPNPV